MKFTYIKSEIKGTEVPQVVFENLFDARNNDLKVILYVIKNEVTDPLKISSDLNISHSAANSSLLYWADKGIIMCQEEFAEKPKKKPALTTEIIATFANDPGVQALCRNLQVIFGGGLSERYTNKFIALYIEESIPVDVILQICQHHITIGIDNPSYIIKVIRSWHTKLGLSTGSQVDEYLALCEKRAVAYKQVCKIFSMDFSKLKSSEKKLIDFWIEKLGMSFEMIEQSYIRAGHLASVPYCNGILKNWAQKGFKVPSDLQAEISNITQSSRNIDAQDDIIVKGMKDVPTFDE